MSSMSSAQRRIFLASAAAIAGAWMLDRSRLSLIEKNISEKLPRLRGGKFVRPEGGPLFASYAAERYTNKVVFDLDLATGKLRTVDSTVPAHVVETHPLDSNLSIVSSKRSDRIALVDWRSQKEVASHKLRTGSNFYGHSAYSADGKYVFAPVQTSSNGNAIAVFELPSLKFVRAVPTLRGVAHEFLAYAEDRFIFVVGSLGTKPAAFATLNFQTSEIEYIDTAIGGEAQDITMTHLHRCGDHFAATINVTTIDGLKNGGILNCDLATKKVTNEIEMSSGLILSEALSLAYVPELEHLWFTIPNQDKIAVWNSREHSLVRVIDFKPSERPTSLTYVTERSLMLASSRDRFIAFDAKTGAVDDGFAARLPHSFLSGAYCAHTRKVLA